MGNFASDSYSTFSSSDSTTNKAIPTDTKLTSKQHVSNFGKRNTNLVATKSHGAGNESAAGEDKDPTVDQKDEPDFIENHCCRSDSEREFPTQHDPVNPDMERINGYHREDEEEDTVALFKKLMIEISRGMSVEAEGDGMIEISRGMSVEAERDGTVREDGSAYSYESMQNLTSYLLKRTKHRPLIGVICGSGMGGLADMLEDKESFPYREIPGFPTSTVAGHKGRLVFGILNGVSTVCMQGRFHVYEGYSLWKCAMPVRVMKLIGIKTLIVTNAAGGLNPNFKVGDIMLIKDHINFPGFAGDNPLRGRNDERWGPRFPAINNAYDLKLRNLAREVAKGLGLSEFMQEGVYAMVGGPNYETVAELRALRTLGADAVGMSTAHEVIAAKHCGLRVFGLSLITNQCVMEYDVERAANHAEVLETSNRRKSDLEKLITNLVAKIDVK